MQGDGTLVTVVASGVRVIRTPCFQRFESAVNSVTALKHGKPNPLVRGGVTEAPKELSRMYVGRGA